MKGAPPLNAGLQKGGNTPLLSPLIRARVGCILPFGIHDNYPSPWTPGLHFEPGEGWTLTIILGMCVFASSCLVATFPPSSLSSMDFCSSWWCEIIRCSYERGSRLQQDKHWFCLFAVAVKKRSGPTSLGYFILFFLLRAALSGKNKALTQPGWRSSGLFGRTMWTFLHKCSDPDCKLLCQTAKHKVINELLSSNSLVYMERTQWSRKHDLILINFWYISGDNWQKKSEENKILACIIGLISSVDILK